MHHLKIWYLKLYCLALCMLDKKFNFRRQHFEIFFLGEDVTLHANCLLSRSLFLGKLKISKNTLKFNKYSKTPSKFHKKKKKKETKKKKTNKQKNKQTKKQQQLFRDTSTLTAQHTLGHAFFFFFFFFFFFWFSTILTIHVNRRYDST